MKFMLKKIFSYGIDYVLTMLFVGIFTFCANVFYLTPETSSQGVLMLVCAFIMVIWLTTYIPTKSNGQTIGQKLMKIRVVNKNGKDRTYLQSFLRECVAKVSFAPIFLLFSAVYFAVQAIIKRTMAIELPHDSIFKTVVESC